MPRKYDDDNFERELASLINRYSIDAQLGMSDWKLAEDLINYIAEVDRGNEVAKRTKTDVTKEQ